MTKTAVTLLLLLALALPLAAQQELPPSGETIDVSLVNVDVFVTDRDGKRVTGLTAKDFEIRENGRVQPVTNFAEYTDDGASSKRTVLLFIDRFSLPSFRTKPLFEALRKTMRDVIRPGDAASIVLWDGRAAFTLQAFTDDVAGLEAALTEVERQSNGVHAIAEDLQRRDNPDLMFTRFRHKLEELQSLMRSISDDEGRKIVIYATNDLRIDPLTDRHRNAVARTANENGVTLYPVSPADPQVGRTAALDQLARDTGGLSAAGSKDIVTLLPHLAEDLERYYSLAYRTPSTGTNRSRGIEVRTKNRDYRIRSRREYVEKTDVTRMQDRVIANLYRERRAGTIPVHIELGKIEKTGRGRWSAPLRINLPLESLSFGHEGSGEVSIFVATGGRAGVVSDVQQRVQAFSGEDFAPGTEHVTYIVTLTFNSATSLVSVGVLDPRSKEFGLRTIEVPPLPEPQPLAAE